MTTKTLNEDSNVVGGGDVALRDPVLGQKPEKRKKLEDEVLEAFEESAYDALHKIIVEGARWDSHSGSWIGGGTDEHHPGFNPHDQRTPSQQRKDWMQGRFSGRRDHVKYYYAVPFAKKDEAKKLGLRWDPAKQAWFSHIDEDSIGPFKRDWAPHGR